MAAIRGKDTKPEMVVRRILHRLGFRYRLHRKDLPGKPDIVFSRLRKIIFVHGCFWHMHDCRYGKVVPATNSEFWSKKRSENADRDLRNRTALENAGWQVSVIWECETKKTECLEEKLEKLLTLC